MTDRDKASAHLDAWQRLLEKAGRDSEALAVGLFANDGVMVQGNRGLRRLLCDRSPGDDCSGLFENPDFAALWRRTDVEQTFEGLLFLGDCRRVNRSVVARARRLYGLLQIVGEVDVVELDRVKEQLVVVNQALSDLQRDLLSKKLQLERSLAAISRKEQLATALAEINRAIRECEAEADLVQQLCGIAVSCGGFKLASVARPDGGHFELLAAAGEVAYLRELKLTTDPAQTAGQDPTARAYRSAVPQVANDFLTDPTTAPWHALARKHGIAAEAVQPITGRAGVLALLQAYAGTAGYFGDDELLILGKIAADVGLALDALKDRQALKLSEARYRRIFEHAPVGLVHYDPKGTILDCNDAYVAIVGTSSERIIGLNLLRDLEDQRVIDAIRRSLTAGKSQINLIYRSTTADKVIPIRGFFADIRDDHGTLLSGMGIVEDFSDRYALEQPLSHREERFRLAVDAAGIGVWQYDRLGHRLHWDNWMRRLHGLEAGGPSDLAAWRRLVHPEDRRRVLHLLKDALRGTETASAELRITAPDGATRYLRLFVRGLRDESGSVQRLMGVCYDITRQRLADEQIRQLAFYDPLTSLANRRLLLDRLGQAFARCDRQGRLGVLLLLDLDGFKRVNDTRGHDVGDELLIELANRLRGELRRADTIARLGGDEFVVLSEGLDPDRDGGNVEANALAEKVLAIAHRPYALPSAKDTALHCAASIGVALFDGRSTTPNEVMKQADIAMFEAKRAGRNAVRFFEPRMLRLLKRQEALIDGLREALEQQELRILYQPQLDRAGRWIGCEALIHWQRTEETYRRDMLLEIAAEAPVLVRKLERWTIEQALRELQELQAVQGLEDEPGLQVGIAISAEQFASSQFITETLALVERSRNRHYSLRLEVTEQILFSDLARSAETLERLSAFAVAVGIGGFSSGFSSLALAKGLPLATIKIGREQVDCCTLDPMALMLVRAAIAVGRALSIPVIAEGIKRQDQLVTLRNEGCAGFQGDLLEPPMPFEDFARRLRQQQPTE